MSSFTSGIGIASGIDIGALIDQMLALEARRRLPLQARISRAAQSRAAIQHSQSLLLSLRSASKGLAQPTTLSASTVLSSHPAIIHAIAGTGATPGATSLLVRSIARSSHIISAPLAHPNTPLGASAITLRFGAGALRDDPLLSSLRGGEGVPPGRIRITDRSGAQSTIDLRHALSIGEVLDAINGASGVAVEARLSSDGRALELVDLSGGSGMLQVQEWGGGTTAASLGILGASPNGVLSGSAISWLGPATRLADIGTGVPHAGGAVDFMIRIEGTGIPVALGPGPGGQPPASMTLGDALERINAAIAGAGFGPIAGVSIAPEGDRLRVHYSGSGSMSFEAPTNAVDGGASGSASALAALGLAGLSIDHATPLSASTRDGARILFGMRDVPLTSLEGGLGLALSGSFTITDRGGRSVSISGLADAESVAELLARIRSAAAAVSGMDLDIGLDGSGTRLRIVDRSMGSGVLQIGGAIAEQLGFATNGTNDTATSRDLRRATVGLGTPLERIAGTPLSGSFRITDRAGASAVIDISASMTVADLARAVDAAGLGVLVRVNAWGDAIELVDASGGTGFLSVVDLHGGVAASLRIAGTSADGMIDGTRTRHIALTGTETAAELAAILDSITGVSAQIEITNAGDALLAIRGSATGARNDLLLVIDGTHLGLEPVVRAADARVLLSPENGSSTLVTSASNSLAGVIAGVTLELKQASTDVITVTVSPSLQPIRDAVASFAQALKSALAQLRQATATDPSAGVRGPLYGNLAATRARDALRSLVGGAFGPEGRRLSRLGITVSSDGAVQFDPQVLDEALESDPDAVRAMLAESNGVAQRFDAVLGAFVDPQGALSIDSQRLDRVSDSAAATITRINEALAKRRLVLLARFAAMESAIERLRAQQASLQSLLSTIGTGS